MAVDTADELVPEVELELELEDVPVPVLVVLVVVELVVVSLVDAVDSVVVVE